jgi:hypothetical protein
MLDREDKKFLIYLMLLWQYSGVRDGVESARYLADKAIELLREDEAQ